MLVISVLVIAITSAAYAFVPTFASGVAALSADVSRILDSGTIAAVGVNRGVATSLPTNNTSSDSCWNLRCLGMSDGKVPSSAAGPLGKPGPAPALGALDTSRPSENTTNESGGKGNGSLPTMVGKPDPAAVKNNIKPGEARRSGGILFYEGQTDG